MSMTVNEPKSSFNNPQVVILKRGWIDYLKIMILGFLILFLILSFFNARNYESVQKTYYSEEFREISAIYATDNYRKLGLINLNGLILSDSVAGGSNPLAMETVITPGKIWDRIGYLMDNNDIEGAIIKISSPGGMVSASEEIAHYINLLARKMPVYVYSDDILASGAYFAAAPANKIYSHPEAEVGGIGVIYEIPNLESLLENKLGVYMETYKSGRYKDINSPYRSRTGDEKQVIQEMVNETSKDLIKNIAVYRKLPEKAVAELATGQVWRGIKAKELKLTDDTMHLNELIDRVKREMKITGEVVLIEYSPPPVSIFEELVLMARQAVYKQDALTALSDRFINRPAGLYYLYYH